MVTIWVWLFLGVMVLAMFVIEAVSSAHAKRNPSVNPMEVERLEAELNASTAQIETLKARLNAVETIVTDEEHQLRREFRKLRIKPKRRRS